MGSEMCIRDRFNTAVAFRLGVPFLGSDSWCPLCDQILTRTGEHATCCCAGGDVNVRHNSLRDQVYFKCRAAGLEAEREEPGLLPDDPRRRPGNVYVPSVPDRGPCALDLAVTCPMQQDMVSGAAQAKLSAATAYEAKKFADRDTAARCAAQGVRLVPLVAETLGGWGPEAQGFFKVLAAKLAETTSVDPSVATAQLYETLGVHLQRHNASALLTRLAASRTASLNSAALAANLSSEAALLASEAVMMADA